MISPHPDGRSHIVVIGGGLAGLAAAYDLSRKGYQITLIEEQRQFGGLASSILLEGHPVDRFYHFICRGDRDLCKLIFELGLENKLHWQKTSTAFFSHGRLYKFGTPLDLLQYDRIPWLQRLRFGFHIVSSRYRSSWKELDQYPAKLWLIKNIGAEAYNEIWHPLLKVKFGKYYDEISAAWIWHRIWRVAKSRQNLLAYEKYGYLQNGSSTLTDNLVKFLEGKDFVRLCSGTKVDSIQVRDGKIDAVRTSFGEIKCDGVISTVSPAILAGFLPAISGDYFDKLKSIQSIGIVCMLLSLKSAFSPYFWTNVNDERIKLNGFIETTNIMPQLAEQGMHLVYIPYYLPTDDPRYHEEDEFFFNEYLNSLKILNPAFDESYIKEWRIFRNPYAQIICRTGFKEKVLPVRTPIHGLYMTDSSQFYPEDRTLSAAIRQGRAAASKVHEDGI